MPHFTDIGGAVAKLRVLDEFSGPIRAAMDQIAALQESLDRFKAASSGLGSRFTRMTSAISRANAPLAAMAEKVALLDVPITEAAAGMMDFRRAAADAAAASARIAAPFAAFATSAGKDAAALGGIADKLDAMDSPISAAATKLDAMQAASAAIAASAAEAARAYGSLGKARLPSSPATAALAAAGGGGRRGGEGGGRGGGGEGEPEHHRFRGPEVGGVPGLFGNAIGGGAGDMLFKGLIVAMMAKVAAHGAMAFLGEGGRVADVQAALAQQGLTKAQIAKATQAAEQAAIHIPGATPSEALAAFMEARAVLGKNAEALAVMPTLLKDTFALAGRGLGGDKDILKLIKALDVQGALKGPNGQLSPEKTAQALHAAVAAMIASQGLLTPAMLLRFVQMAGPGIQNANFTDLLRGYVELLIGIGNRTGRGTGMAFLKLMGGQMTTSQLHAFEKMGLINPKDVGGTKGHPFIDPAKLKGAVELRTKGLVAWEEDVLFPAIIKEYGKLTVDTLERGIAQFPVSAQRVLAGVFTMNAQIKRFGGKGGLFDQALASNLVAALLGSGWSANLKNFDSAFTTLIQTMAAPAVPNAISAMQQTASAMRAMTQGIIEFQHWFSKEPKMRQEMKQHGVEVPWYMRPGGIFDHIFHHSSFVAPQGAAPDVHLIAWRGPQAPPAAPVTVTINAPLTVQGDVLDGGGLQQTLDGWWRQERPRVIDAVARAQRAAARTAARGSMLDPSNAVFPGGSHEAFAI